MGCSGSDLGVITEDDLYPAMPDDLGNTREKTNKFPEGEIYYLRGGDAIKNGAVDPGNDTLYYDKLVIRITIKYKFYKEWVREKLYGSKVRFYHSHLVEEKQMEFFGTTEKFTEDTVNDTFTKQFDVEFCFQKTQYMKCEVVMENNTQVIDTTLGEVKYFLFNFK
ncbi:MAG: hypothetical protein MJ252_13940 [archaeon]|nr:hypothetical protein [archaeon]